MICASAWQPASCSSPSGEGCEGLLRDGYSGASYQDFNDQVLFGEYSRKINEHAVKMIQTAQVKTGEAVQVYGVFSAWDIPQNIPDITPAKIVRLGGQ